MLEQKLRSAATRKLAVFRQSLSPSLGTGTVFASSCSTELYETSTVCWVAVIENRGHRGGPPQICKSLSIVYLQFARLRSLGRTRALAGQARVAGLGTKSPVQGASGSERASRTECDLPKRTLLEASRTSERVRGLGTKSPDQYW